MLTSLETLSKSKVENVLLHSVGTFGILELHQFSPDQTILHTILDARFNHQEIFSGRKKQTERIENTC